MWRSHVVVYGITRQSLCRKGPFIIFTGGGSGRIWGGSCLFLISWRGGVVSFFVLFFWFSKAVFICLTMFLVWVGLWGLLSNFKRKWVMKLRSMIYHVPTKYKIFLSKGVLSPCNLRQGASSLDPCKHLAHRVSFPQFKIEWRPCINKGEGGAEWGLRPLLPFFDDSWGKWATRGNLQLVISGSMESGHGISGGNGTNLRIYYKVMWILPSAENKFLGLLKC